MNDFDGLLAGEYGFKSRGKSAPMSASSRRPPPSNSDLDSIFTTSATPRSESLDHRRAFDQTRQSESRGSALNTDSQFSSASKSTSGFPVYDKPVYDDDDDALDGVPELKSPSSAKYDGLSTSRSRPSLRSNGSGRGRFNDLVAGFGKKDKGVRNGDKGAHHFDDLIPGFGRKSPPNERTNSESSSSSRPSAYTSKATEEPFTAFGSTSPHVDSSPSKTAGAGSTKANGTSASGGMHDNLGHFSHLRKSVPFFSFNKNKNQKDGSPLKMDHRTGLHDSPKSAGQSASSPIYDKATPADANSQRWSGDNTASSDEVWLTVSEIPLFTQPTTTPPPSRPPPPVPARMPKARSGFFGSKGAKKKANEFSSFPDCSQYFDSPTSIPPVHGMTTASSLDELENSTLGGSPNNLDSLAKGVSNEELGRKSDAAASAAAMKEAMARAEAKFRHAKEVREREGTWAARNKDGKPEKDDSIYDSQEQAFGEKQERLEKERLKKEKEEEGREQKRLERERERVRQIERERARQAVERATREARERAFSEARLKAEKAALEKANVEARERAERAAVQRAQAEARERAANEARERAEKAATEAREREAREKAAEARIRAERAAVERVAAEVRQKAAAEAREKTAAAAAPVASRANQGIDENDLDSFFNMGSQATTPTGPRASSLDPAFDTKLQNRQGTEAPKTSSAASTNIRKASSTTNIVDDLSSIFGGVGPSGESQEVEGESEERRRARLERHQRTQERAAKALAEKNQRDLQAQREQEERHRIAEKLDVEIKRWAAGKEGNLRALLSTLHYVLWPECGWQPVSVTDLITAASVKKVYRKATLCVHPDKVQQKGANLQQKYIAGKVFDLLKEAWNKFNSEELF